jgi:hypothetical protein
MDTEIQRPKASHPTLLAMGSFVVRSKALQARRAVVDTIGELPRLREGVVADFPFVIAESTSPLCTSHDPREMPLLLGKIENLRLACRQIHHCVLDRGEIFSFWRQVGPPWRSRGFVAGREVREGCVIPTTGGGLCQLSGSLLEVALRLDFELIERHRHTALPADVPYDARRDATLFWNYMDLRFRSATAVFFESYLTEDSLIVRLRGKVPRSPVSQLTTGGANQAQFSKQVVVESCFACNQTGCIRHHYPAVVAEPRRSWRLWKHF